jgi:hypothetical protein
MPWFEEALGEVHERWNADAPPGAVIVEEGGLKVSPPRLPNEPPPPARAKASAEKAAASVRASTKARILWRMAMEMESCIDRDRKAPQRSYRSGA